MILIRPWAELNKTSNQHRVNVASTGLGSILALWHLAMILWITGNIDQLMLSLVFWGTILYQVSQLPTQKTVSRWRRFGGWVIMGGVAIATLQHPIPSFYVRLFPGLVTPLWILITVRCPLRILIRPALLILGLMAPPRLLPTLLQPWMDYICVFTAQAGAFGLYLIGFPVTQQGAFIYLPQGSVEVQSACTGVGLAGLLLQLILWVIAVIPNVPAGRLALESGAIALLVSSFRVALMAALVEQPDAFHYWHGDAGNQFFTTLALIAFGWVVLRHYPNSRSTITLHM